MPRRNRNPGSGKPPHNGKARNEPASGSGVWGDKNGARELRPLGGKDDEYAERIRARARDAGVMAAKEEVAEAMRHVLLEAALSGDGDNVRIYAADKLLDRLEGKPVQKQEVQATVRSALSDKPLSEEDWVATYGVGTAAGAAEGTR